MLSGASLIPNENRTPIRLWQNLPSYLPFMNCWITSLLAHISSFNEVFLNSEACPGHNWCVQSTVHIIWYGGELFCASGIWSIEWLIWHHITRSLNITTCGKFQPYMYGLMYVYKLISQDIKSKPWNQCEKSAVWNENIIDYLCTLRHCLMYCSVQWRIHKKAVVQQELNTNKWFRKSFSCLLWTRMQVPQSIQSHLEDPPLLWQFWITVTVKLGEILLNLLQRLRFDW